MPEEEYLHIEREDIIRLTLVQSLVFTGITLGYLVLTGNPSSMGITTQNWEIAILYGTVLFIFIIPFLYLPRYLGYGNRLEEILANRLEPRDILALNVAVATGEELFFRGFLLSVVGVIPSAVIFGVMHYIGYESLVEVAYAFAIGIILGFLFKYMMPNIVFPITFHILANNFSLFLTRRWEKKA